MVRRNRPLLLALQTLVLAALVPACHGVLETDTGSGGPGGGGPPPGGRYHPVGFAAAEQHGGELKRQAQDCRSCHGADLAGVGAAPSCDACHDPAQPTAWRSDCTFCHGGSENPSGAPPRNLDGSTTGGAFPAHDAHVSTAMAAPIDCIQCHVKAVDVLSPGHVFDDTPGAADVDFGGGRSPQASFAPATGCANVYCHGSGRGDQGVVAAAAPAMACSSCHAATTSSAAELATMSGTHALHLGVTGVTCVDCHSATTADGLTIADAARHVNGTRDVSFTGAAAGVTMDAAQTCTGTCHGHGHAARAWGGGGPGGTYHPAGWAAGAMHGPEFSLARSDCRSCHGTNLEGGSAPSCNGCHPGPTPTAWRSSCNFCHGGTLDGSGAPPRDPGAPKASTSASFVAHTKHMGTTIAKPMDCVQCHRKPTDVLSAGHTLDGTPEVGEVVFTGGLSPAGTFSAATGCANLYCHGNGRGATGAARDGMGPTTCASCHPGMQSGETAWGTMSGDHRKHLKEGMDCGDCHQTVTANGTTIANASLHVDGARSVVFSEAGITYTVATKRCTGPCHGEDHNDTW